MEEAKFTSARDAKDKIAAADRILTNITNKKPIAYTDLELVITDIVAQVNAQKTAFQTTFDGV